MPDGLTQESVAAWLASIYNATAGDGRKTTYHCDPVLSAQAIAVLALVASKVREAVEAADEYKHPMMGYEVDETVARVMGRDGGAR
jgi:hypothetical protein